jgi:glycosyltransferase involved in cell wall biosynthesis
MQDERRKRVLVFEPVVGGHHLQYARNLVDALSECGAEVTISLSVDARLTDEFRVHLRDVEKSDVIVKTEIPRPADSKFGNHLLDALVELRREVVAWRPDRVYLPYADGLVQLLGACAPLRSLAMPRVPIEALIMRGAFAYPAQRIARPLRHQILYQLLANAEIEVLHVLDTLVYADILRRGKHAAKVARVIPEPVEKVPDCSRHEARVKLGVPPGGKYLVCAGALDQRKGVHLLLQAAVAAPLPPDTTLLLVGRIAAEIREDYERAVAALGSQLVAIDRYVSEEDFGYAIVAADVVAVPYPAHQGSSGLVVRALAAGRCLLSSDYGWVGWITRLLNAGTVCDVNNPQCLQRGVRDAMGMAPRFFSDALAQRFIAYHQAENQRAHWTRGLRESMGQSGSVPMTWQQVIRPGAELGGAAVGGASSRVDRADIRP